MSKPLAPWWDGYLPSHLLPSQVARLQAVTRSAVYQRIESRSLPSTLILETRMVPTAAVVPLLPGPLPFAYAPDHILSLLSQAATYLEMDLGDKPMFTPSQLMGVYFGLSTPPAGGTQ